MTYMALSVKTEMENPLTWDVSAQLYANTRHVIPALSQRYPGVIPALSRRNPVESGGIRRNPVVCPLHIIFNIDIIIFLCYNEQNVTVL